jgi:hypothetical protein
VRRGLGRRWLGFGPPEESDASGLEVSHRVCLSMETSVVAAEDMLVHMSNVMSYLHFPKKHTFFELFRHNV